MGNGDDLRGIPENVLQGGSHAGVNPFHCFKNPSANLQIILHLINQFSNFVGVLNIIKHKHNEQSS